MYLQVPVKLERYINEIKRSATRFNGMSQIALLSIGKSKNGETYKQMFMIYNPYQEKIKITPNFFTSSNKVYKMYPSEFELGADTISAFVLFMSEDVNITINENELLSNIRGEITEQLNLSKFHNIDSEQVEIHRVHKIEPINVEFDKTMDLKELMTTNVSTVNFKNSDREMMDITLNDIVNTEISSAIEIIINNKSENYNYRIKGINLKIDDGDYKIHVSVEENIVIKALTQKKMRIDVNKLEFSLIDQEKMQIKVTIL